MHLPPPSRIMELWPVMLLGTGLMIVGTLCGWQVSRSIRFVPVRFLRWWVVRIMLPLLRTRVWWRRATTIFLNNMGILAGLIALGRWSTAAVIGIAVVGLAMGIALRVLSDVPDAFAVRLEDSEPDRLRRVRVGMWLNMLEPFAIAITLGVALGRVNYGLSASDAWLAFGMWITPPMLIAACGEALWMGECMTDGSGDFGESNRGIPPNENAEDAER